MEKRVFQHILTLFFTVTFLTPRIVDMHAFCHIAEDDSLISCEFCDTISNYNQLDLMTYGSGYSVNELNNIQPSDVVLIIRYKSPTEKIVTPICIRNKPPPFLTEVNLTT